jgi:adenylate cyclase
MKYPLKYNFFTFILISIFLIFSYFNFEKYNQNFDEKLRDIFFEIRGEIPTTNQVIIIDIDERSINSLGQWPFSRIHMAQVLANLANANVGIVGVDIVFAEPDRTSPSHMAKELGVEGEFRDNDEILGSVVAQTPTVLGYYFSNSESKNTAPFSNTSFEIKNNTNIIEFKSAVTSIKPISNSSYSSGFFNALSGYSGKITKLPLILKYKDTIYPSLSFEMINLASGTTKVKVLQDNYSVYALQLNNLTIPVDQYGFMRINFRGGQNSFQYLSFVDILNGKFDPKDIQGKFVLIGTSTTTLADLRATPYDLSMPGVEIHANIIDNILKGDFLYKPSYVMLFDIFVIFVLTVLLGFVLLRLSSFMMILFVLILTTAIYICFYYMQFQHGLLFNLVYPMAAIIITTIVAFYINNVKERRQKEFIKEKFSKKVSVEVVEELLSHSEDTFKARQENITIFFSDIREFTNISEKLDSPQILIDMLNKYLEPMSQTITQSRGTIDKFIGDAIMAYWNAPNSVANHPDVALQSALNQIDQLNILNEKLQKEFGISLNIGIGLHAGVAIVGEMGSVGRSDYTIIGDNVNLASRIEGLTKYFGAKIIISEDLKTLLKGNYHIKYISSVIVKGKTKSIKLYEVLNEIDYENFKTVEDRYNQAITHYLSGEFLAALELFREIENSYSHKLNKLYIEKIESILNQKLDDITIDFIMDSK